VKAIILVAGRGLRLRTVTELPKCLLAPGGTALLDRYVTALDALGIPAIVVAGWRADMIRARLAELAPRVAATVVVNPDYQLGSIVSLACGLDGLGRPGGPGAPGGADESVLLMDGDVLFHPDLLPRLVRTPRANALLVDLGSTFTGEEYMAGVDAGRVTALQRAAVPGHEASGEWVGFAVLDAMAVRALRSAIERQIAAGETAGGYEDALASLLVGADVSCVDASDRPWIEIDFAEDLERAEELARRVSGEA
jgi:choline kinase